MATHDELTRGGAQRSRSLYGLRRWRRSRWCLPCSHAGCPDKDASATGRGADAIEVRFTVFYQSGQGRFGAFCAADDNDDRPLVPAGQSPPVSRYEFAYDTVEDAVSITRASGGAEREVLAAVDYGNLPQLPSPGTGFNHVARCGPGGRLALLGPAGETLIAAVDSQPLRGEVAGLLATSGKRPGATAAGRLAARRGALARRA